MERRSRSLSRTSARPCGSISTTTTIHRQTSGCPNSGLSYLAGGKTAACQFSRARDEEVCRADWFRTSIWETEGTRITPSSLEHAQSTRNSLEGETEVVGDFVALHRKRDRWRWPAEHDLDAAGRKRGWGREGQEVWRLGATATGTHRTDTCTIDAFSIELMLVAGMGCWWRGLDSNQRTLSEQIYSLPDLTTLPPLHRSRSNRYAP